MLILQKSKIQAKKYAPSASSTSSNCTLPSKGERKKQQQQGIPPAEGSRTWIRLGVQFQVLAGVSTMTKKNVGNGRIVVCENAHEFLQFAFHCGIFYFVTTLFFRWVSKCQSERKRIKFLRDGIFILKISYVDCWLEKIGADLSEHSF